MRPLELRLRNFRSYFGPEAVFDFRHRSLVGIVGPIGSGKSSLLDGIAFALYGRTPSEAQATSRLIHQRADQGAVQLRFDVDGEVWEAVRVLRRRGQSQHALYRYDVDAPDAQPVEKITQERQVNERIVELLALDFDTFGRSVLLAQGRFAEFLKGQPADRDRVLKGVFGHDRVDQMREAAKATVSTLAARRARIDGQLTHLEALEARLAQRMLDLEAAEARLETLAKAEPEMDDLDRRVMAAEASAGDARRRRDELSPLGDQLPAPEVVADAARRLADAVDRRGELAVRMDAADLERKQADAVLDDLDDAGERELLAAAEHALVAHRRAAEQLADSAEARERTTTRLELRSAERRQLSSGMEAATALEHTHRQARDAAVAAVGRRRVERHEAAHRHMATELRRQVAVGAPCPVCSRVVTDAPRADPAPDLDAADAALADAEAELQAVETDLKDAEAGTARLRAKVESLGDEVASLEAELAVQDETVAARRLAAEATAGDLERLLGDGDPEAALEHRRRRIGDAQTSAESARRRFEAVRADHQAVVDEATEARARLDELRRGVDRVAGRLGVGDAAGETSESFMARVRTAWTDAVADAEAAAVAAELEVAAAAAARRALVTELGVTGSFRDALAATRAGVERLGIDIAAETAEVEEADDLRSEGEAVDAERALYDRLARDLTNANFVRYLLDEERSQLAALGGDHFMRLSSGRYRFTEDGVFDVVDQTAADAVRKPSSLSGGETFLASLALALALAEMVTRTGGRLDAFLIDEGFGSLDPEHLDLAMAGIEELVGDGSSRLVVVVSHVPELRETVGDLIRLDRDPLTGDTRVIRA